MDTFGARCCNDKFRKVIPQGRSEIVFASVSSEEGIKNDCTFCLVRDCGNNIEKLLEVEDYKKRIKNRIYFYCQFQSSFEAKVMSLQRFD